MASLFVIQGRDQGVRYELDAHGGALYLGRDAENRVQLHDTEVSRRHAEIRRFGEKYLSSIWAAPMARLSITVGLIKKNSPAAIKCNSAAR